jgi:hypothetical protein
MSTRGQVLAKSLHTISVLVNLATFLMESQNIARADHAVTRALDVLGLKDKPDVYGLAEIAIAQIQSKRKV